MKIMADYVDQVNINDTMFSANALSIKEEQYPEDSFIENKVCISETAITTDIAESQDNFWQSKLKQYVGSTILDNIKTELDSFEVSDIKNDNDSIGQGISTDDIKIEYDNGLLYCKHCEAYYEDYCIKCGMLVHILNKHALYNSDGGAQEDIPNDVLEVQNCFGQIGIYALRIIPAGVNFGPFTGLSTTECPWEMKGEKYVLDENKSKYLNWMQYVNPTMSISERNLRVFQCDDNVYYQSTRSIEPREELLVYFGEEYGDNLNEILRVDFATARKETVKDIFACTFCCLGFSSRSHLAKHKTICVEDTSGKFSIEELAQCPFCKINLDSNEYFEHHMIFCCERNARRCILPTPTAKLAAITLNGRTRFLRQIYKCEQCKYTTKYRADLKKHANNQHYEVKMSKCEVCNRCFKTKKSLRLHVENTHAYVGGKDDQEHSTTDYKNTHIKVEQSSLQNQKKIFKCSLCVYQVTYKQCLRTHIKTKHLNEFNYKCNSCKFGTNREHYLERHIKRKHVKEFKYKCDSCEYRANRSHSLKLHIKTKHLKQFDFKCDECKFVTNIKTDLKGHIRTQHLKEFNYQCGSCEYGTSSKSQLEAHIKTIHLKTFDYVCDSCKFRTNHKDNLEIHIKTKHLKQFNYKCDLCEYGTNRKSTLVRHIETRHLKRIDFKCDLCEFRTNRKDSLKTHINAVHLKELNYKCDSCEFRSDRNDKLKIHIKTKHLKEFDFKCGSCEFRTNIKTTLKGHIKARHSTEFDYKCDKCNFGTSRKYALEEHIKTKHLKQFDFKCNSCKFRTNLKSTIRRHIRNKHL